VIKTVIKLKNDLEAKSGDVVVFYEDGSAYTVDSYALNELIKGEPKTTPEPTIVISENANTKDKVSEIRDMLLAGFNISETAILTKSPKRVVRLQKAQMVMSGLLNKTERETKTPIKHYWFKSAESLESARSRGRRLGALRRANRSNGQ
jgi:hypothetical protein